MTIPPKEGWFHRAPRPTFQWVFIYLAIVLALFITVVLAVWARGMWLTVGQGRSAPNVTGNLETMATWITAIGGIFTLLWQGRAGQRDRHVERMDQQARGIPPNPFGEAAQPQGPSPPDSSEPSMINPHGGPGAP